MTSGENNSLLRTIRLKENLDRLLIQDARSKGTNVNSLITLIIEKYAEWDRFTERFGFTSLTNDTLKSILDTTDDEKLATVARELGARVPTDVMAFWFQKTDLSSFLSYVSLVTKFGGFGEAEIKTNEVDYVISIHHSLGKKWSLYLTNFLVEAAQSALKINPTFEVNVNSIVLKFPRGTVDKLQGLASEKSSSFL